LGKTGHSFTKRMAVGAHPAGGFFLKKASMWSICSAGKGLHANHNSVDST
jgi:hypothetical protein